MEFLCAQEDAVAAGKSPWLPVRPSCGGILRQTGGRLEAADECAAASLFAEWIRPRPDNMTGVKFE